jgi:predicted nuclease of predicted toxin-antitoxin system
MRVYTDEDVPPQFSQLARAYGFDVLTAREAGMLSRTDREQLLFAGEQGRCLVTNNPKDFPELCEEFALLRLPHAGVLGAPRQIQPDNVGHAIDALLELSLLYPKGFPAYTLFYLLW